MKITRPAWLEVNLDTFQDNIKAIRKVINKDTKVLSIVKSDGYEFGAVKAVETLREVGVDYFGVATLSEGISIRNHFDDVGLLILGYTPEFLMEDAIKNRVTMACYSLESAKQMNDHAQKLGMKAIVHVVLDTGMNRIGFQTYEDKIEETAKTIVEISKLDHINLEGMFTHFAVADEDEAYTKSQFERYMKTYKAIEEAGYKIPRPHVSNSHATMKYRDFDLYYDRPGILQYGSVEGDPAGKDFDVHFIGAIKALIGHVKTIPAGEGVSYGLTYTTDKESKIATLPLGYADGIPRLLSNKIDVLVNGKRCKQVGRICMDQFMIDVTDVDCKVGDEVVIIGKQGDEEITIEEIAEHAGEIPTSFVTHFNKRLPRVYIKGGEIVEVDDLVLRQ